MKLMEKQAKREKSLLKKEQSEKLKKDQKKKLKPEKLTRYTSKPITLDFLTNPDKK